MDILLFLLNNWDDVLVVVVLGLSLTAGFHRWVKVNGPIFKKMSLPERIAYITRILTNLAPIALTLVTSAEERYGTGAGKLKRSAVIDQLYTRIPDEYKKFITEDNLDAIINKALIEAEEIWAKNNKNKSLVYGDELTPHKNPPYNEVK